MHKYMFARMYIHMYTYINTDICVYIYIYIDTYRYTSCNIRTSTGMGFATQNWPRPAGCPRWLPPSLAATLW